MPVLTQPLTPALVNTQFLRDYAETRGFSLGRAVKPRFAGQTVLFLQSGPRDPRLQLYGYDVTTKTTRLLLTPGQLLGGSDEQLSPAEKARRERQRVATRGFTDYDLSRDGQLVLLSLSGKLYVFNLASGQVQALTTGAGTLLDPKFAPDSKRVSYVLNHDLYELDLGTGRERAVTVGGTAQVSHGLAEFVAQEEMGRFTGYWWSPDTQWLAYEEADSREVELWRVADPTHPETEPIAQPYPRPGKTNVRVRLGVVPVGGGKTTWVVWDRAQYPYLASVRWDQGGPLTLVVQSRNQQQLAVLRADPSTGQTQTLLTEQDAAWINLDQDVPLWLRDGSGFLWTSDRAGAPQLELRNAQGQLQRVLVPPILGYVPEGNTRGMESFRVDEAAGQVYFRASSDPTQLHLWRVALQGGEPVRLSQGTGQFNAVYAPDFSLYVEWLTTAQQLPQFTVRDRAGSLVATLPSQALEPALVSKAEVVRVQDFYATLIRPQDFNPQQRYPVIVDVYGGPGVRKVSQGLGTRLLGQWLADQGFVVVALDNRGTPRQGRAWERAIQGSFGTIPLTDQVLGLQGLAARYPELDLTRVGITGWSFGGYLAALAVLRRPDIFKAAVAGAPVTDWQDYDTHYTERYLGLPQANPQGYQESSLLTYAPDLARPLLLIHGTTDDNVLFLHSLKLSDALFKAGKKHEVLPLNGFTHMVPDPLVRTRLEERVVTFFRENL